MGTSRRIQRTARSSARTCSAIAGGLHAFEQVAGTITAPTGMTAQLIDNFDLGGPLVGEAAGTRPEYGPGTPKRGDEVDGQVREERYPLEGR